MPIPTPGGRWIWALRRAITSVSIWNRTDCCGDRLGDYWVFVSNAPFLSTDTPATLQNRAATFASHQTTAPNPSTIITIPGGMQGQYVRVQLSGTNNLSLAEVQVTGTGCCSNAHQSGAGQDGHAEQHAGGLYD